MEPILQVKNISKSFPGVKALTNVTIDFYPGEVHTLVGENGAGKSTLIKIISGVYIPTEGQVIMAGKEMNFQNPRQALDEGISVIHQELSIAYDLTVAENIYLGAEPRLKNGLLDRRKMNQDAKNVIDFMQLDLDVHTLARDLNAAQQQMVEIAKVISKKSKIVVMDEPTSSLSDHEIHALFKQIRILKENNVAIIYITHRLKELGEICDRVTVLRDGERIKTMLVKDTTEAEIVSSMVGREISNYYDRKQHTRGKEMLRVEGLTSGKKFSKVSFRAYAGEILGVSGLVGAGRTEVMEAIFGHIKLDEGKIFVEGKEVNINSPRDAIACNIGLVTEDRRRTGLMLNAMIKENIALPSLNKHKRRFGFLNHKWENDVSTEYLEKLKIKAPDIYTILNTLSGGNQQKVILAKWLIAESRILILDEPTRGIDVNAKHEFYALMHRFVESGGCIIMVSSEMPEIIGVSDRVIIMREGRITGELSREEASEQSIIKLASIQSE